MTALPHVSETVAFDRDGVSFPIPVLTPDELATVRAHYAQLVAAYDGDLKRFDRSHLFFDWAWDLATHPRVVDAASSILGDDVVVWGSLILSKPPHDPGFIAWHQDGAYASFLGEAPAVSAWIALSDSSVESGCMRVVPGSHKQRLEHAVKNAEDNLLSHKQEIAAEVDENDAVDVVLKAGEMSLHHVDIIHGSNPNTSTWTRTGFIVRYSTPDMLRSVTPIVIARGRAVTHLDVLSERPRHSFETALDAYQAARR
ncbi:MAG TPA: phytanoyl-CoA dioxygenase family protein [Thermoanaerobaculia bacterium]|jgi:ectoine hydroxylase-related dioxygenase (phytanoyl-CoA dioxygenase family)